MHPSRNLSRRLRGYSLMAGALLATGSAADAQVICTDIIPDVEVGGKIPPALPYDFLYNLDLNNDNVYDFEFMVQMFNVNPNGGYDFGVQVKAAANPIYNGIFSYSINYVPWALKLNCGNKVPLLNYFYGISFALFAYRVGNVSALNWNNVVDKYIGVRFKSSAGIHYGWVRLDVNTKGNLPNLVIKQFAYELTTAQHIFVCDTGTACNVFVGLDPQEASPGSKDEVRVFPNPAFAHALVELPHSEGEQAEVLMVNAQGKKVLEVSGISGRSLPLDLSHLPGGMYLIHVQTPTAHKSTRLVKR
ncbi:MAG: T9SS type A sorting domain-containing protein [Chitinophagales bacterium]|nr:T9SS type A sorting domain-containing protein [Chitinophagales bacterium]MDW8394333.1 T9SS type A sorting domain-containing protein [Chitinophagales bacterium]